MEIVLQIGFAVFATVFFTCAIIGLITATYMLSRSAWKEFRKEFPVKNKNHIH